VSVPMPSEFENLYINYQHGYILSNIQNLLRSQRQSIRWLKDVPAICEIQKPNVRRLSKRVISSAKIAQRKAYKTVVTHRIYALCSKLFPRNQFQVSGKSIHTDYPERRPANHHIHAGNPQSITWVKGLVPGQESYHAVIIDGIQYKVRRRLVFVLVLMPCRLVTV
jgi:hypothetical protein